MQAEHPDPEMEGYRPVSGWAIAALLVGLASPLALVHPMLWCLPAAGIGVSIIALAAIERSEIPTVGRKGAIAGLVLSLVFAAAAPTRYYTRNYWLGARANKIAQKWFDAIRSGQTQKAYDLMLHIRPKHPPRPEPGKPPESPQQTAFDMFLELPPVAKLLSLGRDTRAEWIGSPTIEPEAFGRQTVNLFYHIESPKEHSEKPYVVQIQTQRQIEPHGRERWVVGAVWDLQ